MSTKILDAVKPGVLYGEDVAKVFQIAKENTESPDIIMRIEAVLACVKFSDDDPAIKGIAISERMADEASRMLGASRHEIEVINGPVQCDGVSDRTHFLFARKESTPRKDQER